ncbi:hypothetical protein NPIL_253001, partial [Nephila pilipes]
RGVSNGTFYALRIVSRLAATRPVYGKAGLGRSGGIQFLGFAAPSSHRENRSRNGEIMTAWDSSERVLGGYGPQDYKECTSKKTSFILGD